MLAQQYENSGWVETVKGEFTNRAKNTVKNYVPKNTGKVVTIIAGELIENKDIDTDIDTDDVAPNNN